MYPPKRDINLPKHKSPLNNNYQSTNNMGLSSPTYSNNRDLNKINQILENAKTYQRDRDK